MRIVEIVNSLTIGGAERMASDLAVELRSRGHEVSVVCVRGRGPLSETLREAGVEILFLDKGEGFSTSSVRTLTADLRSRRADVIHTHNPLTHHYGVLAGRLAGVPIVVNTFHGPGNLTNIDKKLLLFEVSCLFSDQVVACCSSVGVHLERLTRIARRQAIVIPNGVSLSRFLARPAAPAGKELVIGTVGRLVAVKDHRSLIDAFRRVLKQEPNVKLELLGDGPLRSELEEQARTLEVSKQVTFHGASLDVPTFLSGLHVFVLSSSSEGLPLTLIEAMASGLPVVATAVGEVPELVRRSDAGWICAPGKPEEMEAALLAAVRSPDREAMGARARAYVAEKYSLRAMVQEYERLFEYLCGCRGSRQPRTAH